MKVLVIGSGGREHAIAWKLSQSKKISKLYCAPGNAGIAEIAECHDIAAINISELLKLAKEKNIDFTVVGNEEPLTIGIVDAFQKEGLKIFGPSKKAAQLEGSKVFSKTLMKKYKIPTADYELFDNYEETAQYIEKYEDNHMPIVIKADGLATGKGVIICETKEEAKKAAFEVLKNKKFGDAGSKIVVEQFMTGEEVSVLAFCDGKTIKPMISAKDHKRAYDNDKGLNTGGMGTISKPSAYIKEIQKVCEKTIFETTLAALRSEGIDYRGIIFFGLILTKNGPKVIEYNARFGDPETQVVLPLLKSDLFDILMACAEGNLAETNIEWKDEYAVCVVAASGGYPEKYEKGFEIKGINNAECLSGTLVFHMGTKKQNSCFLTNGGRVICVTGVANTLENAISVAYNGISEISFTGMFYRNDIGKQ